MDKTEFKKTNKFVYWASRILSIVFILFLTMFSLDVIQPGLNTKEIIIGLFMHNIPVLVLILFTVISWKYDVVGGITYILAGLAYMLLRLVGSYFGGGIWLSIFLISGPAFLIGILYIVSWLKKSKFINTEKI